MYPKTGQYSLPSHPSEFVIYNNPPIICLLTYTFHGLGPAACSESELTSETMNSFRHFGRTPWSGDRPIARSLPTQDGTTQETWAYIYASSGIRTNDPCFRAIQVHTQFAPCSYYDRLHSKL